ncbi:uncharacterized protein BO97DRAFT_102256 [Aspergillus homomorphus CBS 101889]|uniref:Telomere replication protein EST3 n=1 Tax=Aspergillus homomorphus (strain CBS 101889) TaxID=1450537 RepID=A0A395HU53_ASPHC|nr:hypothetical protein BO97DRAFT_102256 [Aspergillus homomorphus CBS 101889]RAL11347.1 hypothetical protein BO97DRAFT_102256 [Aspergillus homomorphus CBS 101889]
MMSSSTKWIISMIEGLLNSYLGKSSVRVDYLDDHSNLRFQIDSVKSALVNSCTKDDNHVVKLMVTDSDAQVEAILSREALEDHRKKYPHRPFSNEEVRGYRIRLEDFELVLEYTTATPKVHFYVQCFEVEWGSTKLKTSPQGKTLRKHSISKLIQDASRRAKQSVPNMLERAPRYNDPFGPPANQLSQMPVSQNVFMSQLHAAREAQTMQYPSMNEGLGGAHNLLALLEQPAGARVIRPSNQLRRAPSHLLNERYQNEGAVAIAIAGVPVTRQYTAGPARTNIDISPMPVAFPVADVEPVQRPSSNQFLRVSRQPLANDRGSSVEKVASQSVENEQERPPQPAGTAQQAAENSTFLSPQTTAQSDKTVVRENHSLENLGLGFEDPWKGLTRIEARDIEIPKDQLELLELHKRRWIPPLPGESKPQGHVPPRLLARWNHIVTRRNRAASQKPLDKAVDKPLSPGVPLPDPLSSAPGVDSDSEGEPLTSQWSESSPEQTIRRRPALPEDSSPIRGSPRRPARNVLAADKPNSRADHLTKETDAAPCQSILSRVHEKPASVTGPAKTVIPPAGRSITDRDHSQSKDSDGDSDDSMMDTSVPCPLGVELSQSQFVSQLEREVTSSGPLLPGPATQDQVQVLDTPETNLSRFRHSQPDMCNKGVQMQPLSTQSPRVDNSSSQSRILNSVGSSNNKGSSSQSATNNKSRESNGEPRVDIVGTQLSSQGLASQNPTPYSTAEVVLDSSAPRLPEANVTMGVVMPRSQTPNAFSSHREMPSSLSPEMEGHTAASFISLTQRTPDRYSVGVVSKRRASELEDEELGPSKRSRTQPPEIAEEPMSIALTLSNNSPNDSWEAQQAYGKFCRNYPNYSGQFPHFTKLCSKLQAVRAKGHLQRSFLWDDFILKHLEEFPRYIEQCRVSETKSMEYEEYFASTFSRPVYKKRSLTSQGIAVAAAQYNCASEEKAPSPVLAAPTRPDTSFTGSLVDHFSNLHARSFEPGSQATLSDAEMDISSIMSSPTPHRHPQSQILGSGTQSVENNEDQNMISQREPHCPERDASSDIGSAERLMMPTSSASHYESAMESISMHQGTTVAESHNTSDSNRPESWRMSTEATPTPGEQIPAVESEQHGSQIEDESMADREATPTPARPVPAIESEQTESHANENPMAVRENMLISCEQFPAYKFERRESQIEDEFMADREATPMPAEPMPTIESEQFESQIDGSSKPGQEATPIPTGPVPGAESEHLESQVDDKSVADQEATSLSAGPALAIESEQHESQNDINSMAEQQIISSLCEQVVSRESEQREMGDRRAPALAKTMPTVELEQSELQLEDNFLTEQPAERILIEHVEVRQFGAAEGSQDVTMAEMEAPDRLVEENFHSMVSQKLETAFPEESLQSITVTSEARTLVPGEHDKSTTEGAHITVDKEAATMGPAEPSQSMMTAEEVGSSPPDAHDESIVEDTQDTADEDAEEVDLAASLQSIIAADQAAPAALEEHDKSIVDATHGPSGQEGTDVEMVIEGTVDSAVQGIEDSVDREVGFGDPAEQRQPVPAESGAGSSQPEEEGQSTAEDIASTVNQKTNMVDLVGDLHSITAKNEAATSESDEQGEPVIEETYTFDHGSQDVEMASEEQDEPVTQDIQATIDQEAGSPGPSEQSHYISAGDDADSIQPEMQDDSIVRVTNDTPNQVAELVGSAEKLHPVAAENEPRFAEPTLLVSAEQSDAEIESDFEQLHPVSAEGDTRSDGKDSVTPAQHSDADTQGNIEQLHSATAEDAALSTENTPVGPEEALNPPMESDFEKSYSVVAGHEPGSVDEALVESSEYSDAITQSRVLGSHSLVTDRESRSDEEASEPSEHSDAVMESDPEQSPSPIAEDEGAFAEKEASVGPSEHSDLVMESGVEQPASIITVDEVTAGEQTPVKLAAPSEPELASQANPIEITDSDEEVDSVVIDEGHETASIELGEEPSSPPTTQQPQQPESESEEEDDINENWFLSLRHMRPTGPVWSDSPNTPFKQWVRADQAVLSERYRRGGAYLPVDEKGVIQRPGFR